MLIDTEKLLHITEIHRKLLSGYHISTQDHALFPELSEQEQSYRQLFALLGYHLIADPKGFYYFLPEGGGAQQLNKSAQRFSLITFALVEFYADQGRDPQYIFDSEPISPAILPELLEKYRDLFAQAEILTVEELEEKVLRKMVSYGIASTAEGRGYRMLPPIHRFLDLCLQLHEEAQAQQREGEEGLFAELPPIVDDEASLDDDDTDDLDAEEEV